MMKFRVLLAVAGILGLLVLYWVPYLSLVIVGIMGFILVDIQRRRVLKDQSFVAASRHYVAQNIPIWLSYFMVGRLERKTKNIAQVQKDVLLNQIRFNENTEYGKQYKFCDIKSVEDFIKAHPLTRYSHYETYIERMMKGEVNILTAEQPVVFSVTSGTSGKSNILPMLKRQSFLFLTDGIAIVSQKMAKEFGFAKQLLKSFKIFYNPKWRECEAGIPIGPNSSSPSNSKAILHLYSSPKVAYEIMSEPDALYIHLLFSLKNRHLGMMEANFSSLVFNAFRTMEHNWTDLLHDIETGTLSLSLNIDDNIRQGLQKVLTPDPARAEELKSAMLGGIVGLGSRIWPCCVCAIGADTGTFQLYGEKLRETYLHGIPLYSPLYAATEGLLGVNIWPRLPSQYLLVPSAQFFEFIPIEITDQPQPDTLLMHQLKEGEVYEMVLTNLSCLYRYRFGDVIKVAGFHNQCPIIKFMYRQGQFLSVRGEKTSEATFYTALTSTVPKWPGRKLIDYSCTECIYAEDAGMKSGCGSPAPCYYVFLELELDNESGDTSLSLSDKEKDMLDDTLCSQSYVYSSFRKKGSISGMKVYILKPGSFQALRRHMIESTSASPNQYKVPRVLKKKEHIKFLMDLIT
ncbi:GH3 domain-containing protein-like [Gigantopelta aegis]|uniref:GH3 domain-containing protein-like n=1 Tax=Gigantopelta aegis TaxID=1735272 RepID=UPI001B88C20B|nr:GH3 domain-containing protein-like [Gigantopelta aegis]